MQAVIGAAQRGARYIVDFALPPRCPGCGTVTQDQHSFCLACWQALDLLGEPCCARCGLPFEYESGPGAECGACLAAPPAFDRLRAAVGYGEIARRVALKLKYSGRPGVAETLARLMRRHVPAEDALLVPVPLHRWRIWKRGYNQAALLANGLERLTGVPVVLDALRRVKATPSLRGMGRSERAAAVRGAFAVTEEGKRAIKGREVILIDDVYTSGATANACSKALKRGGAGRVDIICWARVIKHAED